MKLVCTKHWAGFVFCIIVNRRFPLFLSIRSCRHATNSVTNCSNLTCLILLQILHVWMIFLFLLVTKPCRLDEWRNTLSLYCLLMMIYRNKKACPKRGPNPQPTCWVDPSRSDPPVVHPGPKHRVQNALLLGPEVHASPLKRPAESLAGFLSPLLGWVEVRGGSTTGTGTDTGPGRNGQDCGKRVPHRRGRQWGWRGGGRGSCG